MDRDDPDADRRSRARRSLRLFLGRLFGAFGIPQCVTVST